jgi:hypothetical protein
LIGEAVVFALAGSVHILSRAPHPSLFVARYLSGRANILHARTGGKQLAEI